MYLYARFLKAHSPCVVLLEYLFAELEGAAKIFLAHHRILGKNLGRSLEEDASLEEKVGAVGDAQRLLHIVVGDKNTDVLVLEFPHYILNILYGNRVDTREGLVEHDEFGVDGQTTCNLCASALTTREAVAKILAHLFETKLFDEAL